MIWCAERAIDVPVAAKRSLPRISPLSGRGRSVFEMERYEDLEGPVALINTVVN